MEINATYNKYYKLLLLVPAALLLFSLIYSAVFIQKNGDIVYKDVSLTGGTVLTVFDTKADVDAIETAIKADFPDSGVRKISDFRTGGQKGFFIETKATPEEITPKVEGLLGYELTSDNSSVEFSAATLSQGFYKQLQMAILIAFVLMAMVIFIIFRSFVPSFAVILSAFADIMMTVTVVNLLGMQLSTAGIVGFLMLIGYSVDTDILLTSRVLKEKEGSINSRTWGAFKTGMTMSITSLVAIAAAYYITAPLSESLKQIFGILLIGLVFDIFNTWFTNASMLKWYVERKENKQ